MHGLDFSLEDEETLEMFAAQAATAITNARRYGDEQRAKADQAALVDTSPRGGHRRRCQVARDCAVQ